MLRDRLAQKLGASKAAVAEKPNELRVISKVGRAEAQPVSFSVPSRRSAPPVADGERPWVNRHLSAAAADSMWDYAGSAGPSSWAQMSADYAKCASGARQSPIDIRDGIKVDLDPVQFDYKASAFRVVDTGHTVHVNVDAGSSIEVMGRHYALTGFDFHHPAEERIDGKSFEMSVHLIHRDLEGRLAVVAILFERGAAQPVVQSIWNNLPLERGDEVAAKASLNLNDLLPTVRGYYTYMGSMTTPPCTEGVLWMVMKAPMPVSPEQIAIFARLYPMNARPVQSAAGRLIKESN